MSSQKKLNKFVSHDNSQKGIVLIISMTLLVVISLLAATCMRNASSSESTSSNVRTVVMATQAAEIAIRFCEDYVNIVMSEAYPPKFTPVLPTSLSTPAIWGDSDPGNEKWKIMSTWDGLNSYAFSVPIEQINQAALGVEIYKRPPECLIEKIRSVGTDPNSLSNTSSFTITSRGFGPDVVQADSSRSRPNGSEVWIQSNIQIAPKIFSFN